MFFFDAPKKLQFTFQDVGSFNLERIIELHNEIMIYLIFTSIFVMWLLVRILILFREANIKTERYSFAHHSLLEQIWTLIPAFILLAIALPSCSLLYLNNENLTTDLTLRATGWQWYWVYSYPELCVESVDSYMMPEDELSKGAFRVLEVDNCLKLPTKTNIKILTTGADVIHSFAVPSLGLKLDSIPGRVNQTIIYITRTGTFYGQCSELCGINHGFMPIVINAMEIKDFASAFYLND